MRLHLHLLVALASLSLAAGCEPPKTGGGDGGVAPPTSASGAPVGTVSAGLAGIWQRTVAAGTDVTDTRGYSVRLKIKGDGRFSFELATSESPTCTDLERMTGSADFGEGRLVLRPARRVVTSCKSGEQVLSNDPISFKATITKTETLIKEPTLALELSEGPYALKLELLHRDPPADPSQPPRPSDFQLGRDAAYEPLLGTWAPSEGSDLAFYDPSTGQSYVPKYNGAEHRWLRFSADGYELATSFENAGGPGSGLCKKDLVYYESGVPTFSTLREVNGTFEGDVRFEAKQARLVVTLRDCEEDDGTKTYELRPLTSYYKWQYSPGVGFVMGCEYAKHDYQFATCTNGVGWNTLRKR
ncbi:MAG: hypothetical protein JST00_21030 [Deltaproteobacteria bacterium]|nr:hypothetical protein [Deltaproteobacteria bacterium]